MTLPDRTAIPLSLVRASLDGARRRGVDLRGVLGQLGLRENDLEGEGWMPPDRFADLCIGVGRVLRDEAGGFLDPPLKPGTFSMLCHATLSAPNLRRALLRAARFYRLMRDDLVITLAERGEEGLLFLAFRGRPDPDPYFIESFFIVLIRWASWLIDANLLLNRVSFRFGPPEYVDQYENIFPGQHFFHQRHHYVAFPSHYLGLPVVQDSQSLSVFLARAPAGLLRQHRHDISLVGQVRKLLGAADVPDLTLEQAAERLEMSEPTLRRRLRAEGTSFQEIKDYLRRDQAVYLLLHAEATVNQVSEQLGYSEPSTFHRAFKKWTGMTPGEYREAHRPPT